MLLISLDTLRPAAVIGSLKAARRAEQVSLKHLVGNRGSRAQMWPKWSAREFRKIPLWLNKWTDWFFNRLTFSKDGHILAHTVAPQKNPDLCFLSGRNLTMLLHPQHSNFCNLYRSYTLISKKSLHFGKYTFFLSCWVKKKNMKLRTAAS